MIAAFFHVFVAMLLLIGLALFFVGFVLAPIIVLAVGLILFTFAAGDR